MEIIGIIVKPAQQILGGDILAIRELLSPHFCRKMCKDEANESVSFILLCQKCMLIIVAAYFSAYQIMGTYIKSAADIYQPDLKFLFVKITVCLLLFMELKILSKKGSCVLLLGAYLNVFAIILISCVGVGANALSPVHLFCITIAAAFSVAGDPKIYLMVLSFTMFCVYRISLGMGMLLHVFDLVLIVMGSTGINTVFSFYRWEELKKCEKLRQERDTDGLTQLLNRKAAEIAIEQKKGEKAIQAMLVLDIDDFKSVNDKWGHLEGDKVLKKIAELLLQVFGTDALSARLGGDEFLVFVSHGKKEDIVDRAQKLLDCLINSKDIPTNSIDVSCSVGVSFSDSADKMNFFNSMYAMADEKLYKAKKKGKNRLEV